MTSTGEVLPREIRPASGLAPLVEVDTVEPVVAQQLVLAIGTSAQPARTADAPSTTAPEIERIMIVM
jgi:hypothetical protein